MIFISPHKKRGGLYGESPLSEKDHDHSHETGSAQNTFQHIDSKVSIKSNLRSKRSSHEGEFDLVDSLKHLTKTLGKHQSGSRERLPAISDKPTSLPVIDVHSLSKKSQKPERLAESGLDVKTKQLIKESHQIVECANDFQRNKQEILINQNVLPTFKGSLNMFGNGRKGEDMLPQSRSSEIEKMWRTDEEESGKKAKMSLIGRHVPDVTELRKSIKGTLKPDPSPAKMPELNSAQKPLGNTTVTKTVTGIDGRRIYLPSEILALNSGIYERTYSHFWEKQGANETPNSLELFNVSKKKYLTILDSKAAHLDAIRRLEFVEGGNGRGLLVTLSDDATIRTWRLVSAADERNIGKELNHAQLNGELRDSENDTSPERLDKRNAEPTTFQPQKRQFGRAASSFNLDTVNRPNVKIKRGEIVRGHSGAILSSCTSKQQAVTRLYSGDRFGTVNCFELEEERLQRFRTFKTGSEPVWSVATLSNDILVTSTPNKVKLFNVMTSHERKEEAMFENKTGLFGPMKAVSPTTFVVNSFNQIANTSEFQMYDSVKLKLASRFASKSAFCNALAVISESGILLSANEDQTVSLFDLRDASVSQSRSFCAHASAVIAIDACHEKNLMVTGGSDSSVRLWDLRNQRIHNEIHVHRRKFEESVLDVKFDAAAKLIGSTGADGVIKIFHF